VIKHCLRGVEPDLRVVGVVDPNEQGARSRLAECDQQDVVFYKNLPEMVRKGKLDALAIGTRCNLHAPYAIEAAQYDLPLYLEKPVAVSMKQAVALERAFEKSKCRVVVSFPLRVSPLCRRMKRHLEEGAVGRPDHAMAFNYVPYGTCYWDMEYRNFTVTQGLFLQKATHDFDYLTYLMDSPIVRVAAMATYQKIFGGREPAGLTCSKCRKAETCLESPQNRKRNASGGLLEDHPCTFGKDCGSRKTGTNEDSSSALIEFASGAHGTYAQVFYSRRDAGARGAVISGYHGTLSFDWYKNEMKFIRHHQPFSDTIKAGEGLSHFGGDAELALDFIGLIKGKAKSRTTIQMGVQSVYTCLAAKESAETGRFVKVRQVGQ
jgi:predicted dehydrogenase